MSMYDIYVPSETSPEDTVHEPPHVPDSAEYHLYYEGGAAGEGSLEAPSSNLMMTPPEDRNETDRSIEPDEPDDSLITTAGYLAVQEPTNEPVHDATGGGDVPIDGPPNGPPVPGGEVGGEGDEGNEPNEQQNEAGATREATDVPGETAERREAIPQAAIDAVVDVATTTPMRLLAAAMIAADPARKWTQGAIQSEINKRLADWAATQPDADELSRVATFTVNNIFHSYSRSFIDRGLVHQGHNDRGRRIVRANPAAADTILEVTGTLIGWQADHPDFPLQDITGTQYRDMPSDSERGAASLRLAILREANGVSHGELARNLGELAHRVEVIVREMIASGVVEVHPADNARPTQPRTSVHVHPDRKGAIDDLTERLAALQYATPEELTAVRARAHTLLHDSNTLQLFLRLARLSYKATSAE